MGNYGRDFSKVEIKTTMFKACDKFNHISHKTTNAGITRNSMTTINKNGRSLTMEDKGKWEVINAFIRVLPKIED